MQVFTIELLNENALALLQQLEQLNILRFVASPNEAPMPKPKRQWVGSISKETSQKMLQYTQQSRQEWKRNI